MKTVLLFGVPLVFAAFAGLLLAGLAEREESGDALPSALVGQDAPEMNLTPLGDLPALDRAALEGPGPKLVNFWASWCVPCRAEHPLLEGLSEEAPLYGIAYKDKQADSLAFLAELGNPFDAASTDDTGRTGIEWGLYGVPETFVLDGDGTIVLRHAGPLTPEIVERDILPALEAAGG
ncbi:DsbE family thiol:disulfide interchange protein [Roseicyclus sp. F158]|uniref:DsbE family thiol:disulfide interchange protein n=1 Tax=Tropicimonas omnivorans TaxID=3075590 RepID=A0ABU3DIG5_9RHOB|nr:DsbE family thiol:disulfide interchange protein [Roseicyclus sp. F158]MDT0683512.1 DsbE family thiol:disulfide interchange protein [Roseicyclus sp. F158]